MLTLSNDLWISTHPISKVILPLLFLNLRVIRRRGRNKQNPENSTTPPPPSCHQRLAPGARNIIIESLKNIPGINVFINKR